VLRTGGDFFLALYRHVMDAAPDVRTGVRDFFDGAGQTLVATEYADACPIATVAGEVASSHDILRRAAEDVFELWLGAVADDLADAGVARATARPLALQILALLEGALLLCRSLRSTEPMDAARDAAVALTAAALAA
jgi:AcrR family transcriptional regulator